MKIIERYPDMANKWRVKVQLDNGECVILKFQKEPKDTEALDEAQRYVSQTAAQQAVISGEMEKMNLVRDIPLQDLKMKLGVKDGTADTR